MALAQWTDAVEWLAAAAQDPQACKNDWRRGSTSIHLLPAGRLWDVLIVPTCLGLRMVDVLDSLPCVDVGPVLLEGRRQRTGFFLPLESGAIGDGTAVRYRSTGGWIAAPAPHCRWGDLRWLTPPDGSGILNSPEVVKIALQRAAEDLACTHGSALHINKLSVPGHSNRRPGAPHSWVA